MASLYLSDILKRAGIDIKRSKLIRHSLNNKGFKSCYDLGFIKEYTQKQTKNFSNGYDYWIIFISDKGTSAKLECVYKINGASDTPIFKIPNNFPIPKWGENDGVCSFFNLEKSEILEDMVGRLIIDWGTGARMWHNKATTEKPILAIQTSQRMSFTGFENLILSYNELKKIIEDTTMYENWHTALSSVYAIYLITDKINGKQYIGSAYGTGGLLSRWKNYVITKHGGNEGMKEVLDNYPERYKHFQFSILQILPKTITKEEVIKLENLYKEKLLTREFGMNNKESEKKG